MSHILYTSSIKRILKVSLACSTLASFLTGCGDKGNQGSASFTPTVAIIEARCSTDGATLNLKLQNNSSAAMISTQDDAGFIFCTSGQTIFSTPSSYELTIPANGTAAALLTCDTEDPTPDCSGATPSTVFECQVGLTSESATHSSGFFAITTQLISCAST